ncbi:hypothetical protein [Streptomyces lavendulae]|uniref:hypothetical protein n=1 Tax=Streptomyces lavendulae TaxID=1914 RepID=UPI0036E96540
MLDLRTGVAADDDPGNGSTWGTERQVRGAVIAVLLLAGPAARPGRVRALRLAGARVTGELDLTSAIIDCEIHFEVCSFSGVLSLRHATSLSVSLCGSSLPELSAEALRCPGLDMRDAVVEGNVWVQGSDITIDLNLDRARVGGWINGNLLTIGSWFNGRHGLSVGRFVSLAGARINGIDLRQSDIGHAGASEAAFRRPPPHLQHALALGAAGRTRRQPERRTGRRRRRPGRSHRVRRSHGRASDPTRRHASGPPRHRHRKV